MTRAKIIRAWLAENGHDCPSRGSVPAHLVQLYDEAHADQDETVEDEPIWSVTVTIPAAVDRDVIDTISSHLLEALWHTYYAGVAAGRSPLDELLEKLNGGPE
jgi:hypothetical protein